MKKWTEKDLETAIEAYQDGINKNISAGDLLVLKDSMVNRLQAIQGEAIILLVLELVGPKGSLFELFTTLKDAPSKLLQNITNEVDFKDDMVQLLVKLNILNAEIDIVLNNNILDIVIEECLSGLLPQLEVF